MMQRIGRLRSTVFGLTVVSALGFGVTQALAAPGQGRTPARACNPAMCDWICVDYYGATGGDCVVYDDMLVCACYW
jgi:hypothetical protein